MFSANNVSLNNRVFGFGGTPNFEGFTSSKVASGFNFNGVPVYFTPRNSKFMPFAIIDGISGFTKDGNVVLPSAVFAAVNRFILTNDIRHTYTTTTSTRIPVQYTGGGTPTSLGTLRIGDTVIKDCPPVICVAVQGAGGHGGRGNNLNLFFGWTASCGGGGGSGAYSIFMFKFPHTATESIVFYMNINNGVVSLYPNSSGAAFCTANKGSNGVAGVGSSDVGSSGGNGGSLSILSTSSLPLGVEAQTFYIVTADGSGISYNGIDGGKGGQGGGQGGIWVGIPLLTRNGTSGSSAIRTVYINNKETQVLKVVGAGRGGTSGGGHGGGGSGSILGRGGYGVGVSAPSNWTLGGSGGGFGGGGGSAWGLIINYDATGYGSGGGGGNAWATGSNVGGSGAPACIQFIWGDFNGYKK